MLEEEDIPQFPIPAVYQVNFKFKKYRSAKEEGQINATIHLTIGV